MISILLLCAGGLVAGMLLLPRIPIVRRESDDLALPRTTVIIPARNEENNLQVLLASLLEGEEKPTQVLVVDDHSIDKTFQIAQRFGAQVVRSAPLPYGWTGKTWACYQGARKASEDVLCFLDADTRMAAGGFRRMMRHFAELPANTALSVLPFHETKAWFEQLSLFFNVVLAMAAGGFGAWVPPCLFGQSLILPKQLYVAAGTHEAVRGEVLEHFKFAVAIRDAGGCIRTTGGRGTLHMRMFPDGFEQLYTSWQKAFASGAQVTPPFALALTIYWLSSLASIVLLLLFSSNWMFAFALYGLAVLQIAWFASQLGSFRLLTAILFPVPLVFYFVVFGQSACKKIRRRPTVWRGRRV